MISQFPHPPLGWRNPIPHCLEGDPPPPQKKPDKEEASESARQNGRANIPIITNRGKPGEQAKKDWRSSDEQNPENANQFRRKRNGVKRNQ